MILITHHKRVRAYSEREEPHYRLGQRPSIEQGNVKFLDTHPQPVSSDGSSGPAQWFTLIPVLSRSALSS